MSEFGGDDEAVVAYEGFSCCADTLFAVGCQGDVSCAGVSAIEGPFCFAVTNYEGSGGSHCWGEVGREWWGVEGIV